MHTFTLSKPDVCARNVIISKHTKHGELQKALHLFRMMLYDGLEPDAATFLSLLTSSETNFGYPQHCRLVHDHIVRSHFEDDGIVGNSLVHAYGKSGNLDEAYRVFKSLKNRDILTWGSIMFTHFQHGHGVRVFELYENLDQEGIMPDKFIYVCALKACNMLGLVERGLLINADIVKRGMGTDTSIGNALVDMYSKNGNLEEASKVFKDMLDHDAASWGALIGGYSSKGDASQVLELFQQLQQKGEEPNNVIFLFIVKACSDLKFLEQGMLLHDLVMQGSLEKDLALGSAIVGLYSTCGELGDARKVFDSLPNKDVVAWAAMIGGYAQSGRGLLAFGLFARLQEEGMKPSDATFSSTLKVCGIIRNLDAGRVLHHQVVVDGLELNEVVVSALADMYAKCGDLIEAHMVFDILSHQDSVSWGAMIARLVTQGQSLHALQLFQQMQEEGIKPVKYIYLCIVNACSTLGALLWGTLIHWRIVEDGLGEDVVVGNALINLYAKGGSLSDARKLFDQLPNKDATSWNTMAAGYTSHGHDLSALGFVEKMHFGEVEPSKATYSNFLKVCGNVGAFLYGKLVHDIIVRDGLHSEDFVGSALVEMYAKCGCLGEAQKIFDELRHKDIVSWGAITAGYALHGNLSMARRCFWCMQRQGLCLSEGVFTNMIVAFARSGLLEEGCQLFSVVSRYYPDFLTAQHYTCIIDLLGRGGRLDDAGDFSQSMPILPSMSTWRSLLTSCRKHGNMGLGINCLNEAVDSDTMAAFG